jgi:uncharacterized protein involved in exopolysaccharide biosynthesis
VPAETNPRSPASPPVPASHRPAPLGSNGTYSELDDPEVTDLLGVLHRRRWWIAAVVGLGALIGYGLGSLSPVEARAETRLLLTEPSEESVLSRPPEQVPLEERQSAVVARVESPVTEADVIDELDLEPGDIKSISADAEEGESFVTVRVTTDEGVDTAVITDQVAETVIDQQRDAFGARSNALAAELRQSAADIDTEIAAVDAQLQQSSRDIAALQGEVDRSAGTSAGLDSAAELDLKTEMASGLRSTRAALVSTQSDFERRAKEADVAAAVSSGGLEVYAPAGAADTARAFPPLQLAVLLASIGLVVMVGAAYFSAYRSEGRPGAHALASDLAGDGHAPAAPEQEHDDNERGSEGGPAVRTERT